MQQEGKCQIDVRQERTGDTAGTRKRVTLTEEAFWELLNQQASQEFNAVHSLIDRYRKRESITIDPTESSIVVRLNIQDTGQQASI